VSRKAKRGTLKTDRTDQLPSNSEGPTLSSIYRRNTNQRSTRQSALSQAVGDVSSSTGLPPSLQADSEGLRSPAASRYSNTDLRSVFGEQGLPPRDMMVNGDEDTRPEALHPAARIGLDDEALNEVVVELASDSDSGRSEQHVVVVTEPISIQGHGRSRPPSRQPSVTPSRQPSVSPFRPSRQRPLRPPQAGSTYQRQVPSLSLNAFDDPQQFQGLDDPTISEYPGASRPAWYVPPGPDDSSAYGATSRTLKQPQGHYDLPIPNVTLAPSHEPRPSVAEQIARFDQGSLGASGPPSHTHRWLSKPFQQIWTGAPASQPGPNGIPSEIPPGPYLERSVSRRGDRRPISTAGSAHGAPRMPLVSRGTQSVSEQRSNVQRPHPKQYRRQSPPSDSGQSLRSAMDSNIDRQPQAHPMPSRHGRDQPPPSRRGNISRGKSPAGSSERPLAKMVATDDPLTADGSGSSSSASSAALEKYEPESGVKGGKLPLPGTVGTLTLESRTETTSRAPPPSIYVVPSPPPPSRGGTQVSPPTSMADARPTLRPTTKGKRVSLRTDQKELYPEQTQQSASQRPESSHQPKAAPQSHRTAQAPASPQFRGPPRSSKRLHVPAEQLAMPGLSRRGSRESLQEISRPRQIHPAGVINEGSSEHFTGSGSGWSSGYSNGSDDSFNGRSPSPSPRQTPAVPRPAYGDTRSHDLRHVDDHPPLTGDGRSSQPTFRQVIEHQEPFPGPPSQQRPVGGIATSQNEQEKRGREIRRRSRVPGGFPGGFPGSA
jgi:hypothetical protein